MARPVGVKENGPRKPGRKPGPKSDAVKIQISLYDADSSNRKALEDLFWTASRIARMPGTTQVCTVWRKKKGVSDGDARREAVTVILEAKFSTGTADSTYLNYVVEGLWAQANRERLDTTQMSSIEGLLNIMRVIDPKDEDSIRFPQDSTAPPPGPYKGLTSKPDSRSHPKARK